jgi:hypothetical protein
LRAVSRAFKQIIDDSQVMLPHGRTASNP